jgi:hypothetical protein
MTGIVGALIFCCLIVLGCLVVDYVVSRLIALMGWPGAWAEIARLIIMLVGFLLILQKLYPLAMSYV